MKRNLLIAAALLAALSARADNNNQDEGVPTRFNEATVAQLQALMASGELTSVELTQYYLARIHALDENGPAVNSVIELNPDALALAKQADQDRKKGHLHGPLHGIPVLLKDNIDTGDKMQTTAGSFALVGQPPLQDSTVAANLRKGGAVILGKTNLSEWANFRGNNSISGWSGRGGQTHNPYYINRNPCGSSSGSGAAASANFAAVSFGSETDGSIVCPGNANGVVALKPTVGLTSRAGVVPISHTQDTVGPHARTVADAAAALGAIQSRTFDGRDPATGAVPLGWRGTGKTRPAIPTDYTKYLDPNGLRGARLGVTRQGIDSAPAKVVAAFDAVVAAMEKAGATIVPVPDSAFPIGDGEFMVLCYDFKFDIAAYFKSRIGVPVAGGTIETAIAFNKANAAAEMPFFNQEIFELTASINPDPDYVDPNFSSLPFDNNFPAGISYNQALQNGHDVGAKGIDAVLAANNLDAIIAPTDNPAWATDLLYGDKFLFGSSSLAAPPGYPIVQVPAGDVFGIPLGISFFGTAFSEPTLIKLASGFEAVTHARANNLPRFLPDLIDSPVAEPSLTPRPGDGARAVTSRGAQPHKPRHL